MVDVAGKPRVRITIVDNISTGINVARTNLLEATMRIDPKLIWRSKI
jgi:hypothetical protein